MEEGAAAAVSGNMLKGAVVGLVLGTLVIRPLVPLLGVTSSIRGVATSTALMAMWGGLNPAIQDIRDNYHINLNMLKTGVIGVLTGATVSSYPGDKRVVTVAGLGFAMIATGMAIERRDK